MDFGAVLKGDFKASHVLLSKMQFLFLKKQKQKKDDDYGIVWRQMMDFLLRLFTLKMYAAILL